MSKINGVYVDIADLVHYALTPKTAEERSDWLLSLAECLRTENPELNKFGAELLKKAKEYKSAKSEKARESARKRWNANACESMQTDANACERIETHADGCEPMRADANPCYNIRKKSMGYQDLNENEKCSF
jgi:hypothetical protein